MNHGWARLRALLLRWCYEFDWNPAPKPGPNGEDHAELFVNQGPSGRPRQFDHLKPRPQDPDHT